MSKTHGYQLPSGDAFTADLSCALVFYPDKDEYRRALLGALTYFEKWLAWELDPSKRGQDAARAWSLANACTLECWNMACIDELLETMEAVKALLENRKDCCDDNVSYGLQDAVRTEIDPGVGDPPDEYGETAIETWEDWEEHVCYNAHLYVDNLKNIGNQIGGAVEQNSLFLGLIAAGLVLLTFSGVGLPVAYLLASFVVTGLVLAATSATFSDTADELEAAREDIVCALIMGGDLAGEVEAAIGSAAWELFYQFVDYDSAIAIIHEGGIEGDYLPTETRDDCGDCPTIYDFSPTWDFEVELDHPESPWTTNGPWHTPCGGSMRGMNINQDFILAVDDLREHVGLAAAGTITLHKITWVWMRSTTSPPPHTVTINFTGGPWSEVNDNTPFECTEEEHTFDPPVVVPSLTQDFIEFTNADNGNHMYLGHVQLDFDAS